MNNASPSFARIITCEDHAAGIAAGLVRESIAFELSPLPDDEWIVTYKQDQDRRVHDAFAAVTGDDAPYKHPSGREVVR